MGIIASIWNKVAGGTSKTGLPVELRAGTPMTLKLPGGAKMEMVWCPPGTFTMGSPEDEKGHADDEIQHQVTLTKGFWMAKTAVTWEQWCSVMGENIPGHKGAGLLRGSDKFPVKMVNWEDCMEFCTKTGLALPTEAEWEYACRAGSTGPYAGTGVLYDMGWYAKNSFDRTQLVGHKEPNAWGLYDMHGNVWELCSDCYENSLSVEVLERGISFRFSPVLRGGSYLSNAEYCRSATRLKGTPGYRYADAGFRPVVPPGLKKPCRHG